MSSDTFIFVHFLFIQLQNRFQRQFMFSHEPNSTNCFVGAKHHGSIFQIFLPNLRWTFLFLCLKGS